MGAQLSLPLTIPGTGFERTGVERSPAARRTRAQLYEGAAQTARTSRWVAPTSSPNQALHSLTTLRDRSRAAVRNEGYAAGTLSKLVTNIVGTGIKPLSKAADPKFRTDVQALWFRWTEQSDADGLLDWYGQQAQAVRSWLEAGECFLRKRVRDPKDGLLVPYQIQVIEPELCPHTYNATRGPNKIRAGIEFDPIGRRVAYYFYFQRPGSTDDFDISDLRRVPAESVIHLFNPIRPGQIRGIPHLTQALVRLHEIDKFEDAVLLRSQIANLFAAFIERESGEAGFNPITGLADTGATDTDGRPLVSLEPGITQELAPGEKLTFSNPPNADPFGPAFMKAQLMGVAAATDVPYEVITGDMAGLSDRVMRVVLHEFRRAITAKQHHIVAFQVCRPVWSAWMDSALLAGLLPAIPPAAYAADPAPWQNVKWMPQGWPYIHPVQDVTAAQSAIKAGFTSRQAVVSEQGEDSEVIDLEQAEDNARAQRNRLKYDSDTSRPEGPPPPPASGGSAA